jgi:hypothetical protein
MQDNLEQVRENIEQALKHVNQLIHPAIWMRLNDLCEEITNQIEEDTGVCYPSWIS